MALHVDIVLNPLGMPSRMNVGQILEMHLGWACAGMGKRILQTIDAYYAKQDLKPLREPLKKVYGDDEFIKSVNDTELLELARNLKPGVPIATAEIRRPRKEADIEELLRRWRGSKPPDNRPSMTAATETTASIRQGHRWLHLHAQTPSLWWMTRCMHERPDLIRSSRNNRSVAKLSFGGQRFGEMEVWALEAYGAAYILQELLTVKSDDVAGRTKVYEAIVRGDDTFEAGIPESFNVLVKEMRSLGLNVDLHNSKASPSEAAE